MSFSSSNSALVRNLQTMPSFVRSAEIPLWHEGSKTYIIVVCPTAFAIEKGVGDLWQSVVLCRVRAAGALRCH